MPKIGNIVLVHGGFVDGAGWRGVYDILKKDGFNVSIVQNPTISLAGDARATKLTIDSQQGPVILVGHSYGGAVITEAGTNPKVVGLVYITAFAPDKGESVNTLIANPPPGAPVPPILPPADGYLFLDKAKFPNSFAGDVDAATAAFMADSQVPWGVDALAGAITEPAWKSKPSWYLQVRDDKMIPYPAQQFMAKRAGATVVEVSGSHAIYVSNPSAVAALIKQARERCEVVLPGAATDIGNADRALSCLMVGLLVRRSDNRSSAVRFKRVSACIPFSSSQLRGRRSPRCLANRTL
jgi:pimeloyl-ACP methyl ester carboxylesterase